MAGKYYNRIKIALLQKKRTAKQLAKSLKKDPSTVSRWCQNKTQPSISLLFKIGAFLEVEPGTLLNELMPGES